ncbi:NAD(P)H-binding protein [Nocardia otitidiscaviarum]|uniref:NmrA family NAD(P)-binding protein n=1 Tax=Nocardia otitidiscaviarum TaxID=1823 RepID=UPI0004A73523|nr:NmrA family NAD(P)-binding protein [Nocardia otitidiscaviarum]MBF6135029.1 NAD(P)H-binding protein [Nocardia otitidiscaviarum]MBF6486852.1 NAD(P)H-binding protein [Nocardia otitidiscaviarum]
MNQDAQQPAAHVGTVAVTGANGELGRRVAALIAESTTPLITISRDPSAGPTYSNVQRRGPAEYSDGNTMREALDGAETMVLVSGRLSGRRLEDHATAVNAALSTGVQRIIYVSLIGASPVATYRNARDHWLTERFIAETGARYTLLRAGFYSATLAGLANQDLVIRGPGGSGRTAFVSHDDIASVVAAIATDPTTTYDGETLEITGPESITIAEATEKIAAATGRPYRYQAETLDEAFRSRYRMGMSGNEIEGWISWYQAIALGHLDRVSDIVQRVTGTAPARMEQLKSWPEPDAYV